MIQYFDDGAAPEVPESTRRGILFWARTSVWILLTLGILGLM